YEAGHREHLVAAHDERPRLPLGARHLRVDEHVLDLPPPTREPVAWLPSAHSKPSQVGTNSPLAPADLAGELHWPALQPEALVLAPRLGAGAQVGPPRAAPAGGELG